MGSMGSMARSEPAPDRLRNDVHPAVMSYARLLDTGRGSRPHRARGSDCEVGGSAGAPRAAPREPPSAGDVTKEPVMGQFTYNTSVRTEIDDRALAHLQIVEE
jgi:hypothetical protein